MNDEMLIEAVRIQSVLYDLSHPKYMDAKYKNNIWNEIGRKLKCEGSMCRSRWCNIRDQYRKSLVKAKAKKALTTKKVKKYKYHELMSFLAPNFQEQKKAIINAAENSVEESSHNSQDSMSSETIDGFSRHFLCPESPTAEQLSEPSTSQVSNSIFIQELVSRPSSSLSSTQEQKNSDFKSSEASLIEYLLKQHQARTEDPVDKFLEGVAPTLKSMPPYFLNLAKSEIFSVVQKYEMKTLTENRGSSVVVKNNEQENVENGNTKDS